MAGLDKSALQGLSPEKLEQSNKQEPDNTKEEDVVDQAFKEAKSDTSSDDQSSPKDETKAQDANGDVDKYKNLLVNTFGFSEDEISEKDIKLAKSYAEAQSGMTRSRQEALEAKQTLTGLSEAFKKAPSLYEQLVAVAEGKEPENLSKEGNRKPENPTTQVGQLETPNEETLIQQGYLKQSELDSLDEVSRQRKITQAELRFEKDKMLEEYKQGLVKTQEDLRKQAQQDQATQLNKERVSNGFDEYVTNYGVNIEEVTDEQLSQIQQHARYIRDPQNPTLISEDAIEIAANRVLGKSLADKQPLETGKKKVDDIVDTGKSVSKVRGNQPSKNDLETQLQQMARENFQKSQNPIKYKQNLMSR